MALIIEDRVKETTTSTGTGPVLLAGAPVGHRRFSSVCALGDTVTAAIVAVDGSGQPLGEWEAGLYTYSATNTLTRTTVYSSSNNDLAVNFSAGTKHVYIDVLANYIKQFVTVNPDASVMPYGQDPANYTALKFQDEFSGLALDSAKWDTKLAFDIAPSVNNYRVDGGMLHIWPQRDASGAWISRNIPAKFYQIYGYYEVEAQLPIGAGLVPAFWLFSTDTSERPTVDIMKTYGATPWQTNGTFVDWKSTVYSLTSSVELGSVRGSVNFSTQDLSNSLHKYGVLWEPSGFTFFIDGIPVGTKVATTLYTKRMYLILSLGAGSVGSLSGTPTIANTPEGVLNPMRISYVRIWQLANAPAGSDNPPPSTGGTVTPLTASIDYFGDSTIKGWDPAFADGTLVANPAPSITKTVLGSGVTINNYGVNGANTRELIDGTDGHAMTWAARQASTSKYFVVNNCLNDAKTLTLAAYQTNLRQIVDVAKANNKILILETPNPADAIPALDSFVAGMRAVAVEKNAPVIDQHSYLSSYMAQNSLGVYDLCPDGLHPSQTTYNLKGEYAASRINEIIRNGEGTTGTGGTGGSGTAPVGQDPSLWELTFEDHFDGVALDRTKWNRGVYYEASTPGTFKVENSNLVMCYQDPFKRGNCTIDTDPQGWDIQGPGFQQLYGYFEARIKLPYGQNVFPAFWLFRHDQREFDIMENFGGSGATWTTSDFHPINIAWTVHRSLTDTRLGSAALHNDWYRTNNGSGQLPGSFPYSWLGVNVLDLSADYHVYACEWGAGYIRFLFDGKVVKDQNGGGDPFTFRMTEFNGFPMYIMLDFWMENGSAGSCPRGFGPWEMRVDYVRAWRRL